MSESTATDSFIVRTLGCKANLADSQRLEAELARQGWSRWEGGPSPRLCIVNSCSVTDEADRQSRQLAARLRRDHPGAAIVVTGCSAEIDPERLAGSAGISYVIGNRDKPELVGMILERLEKDRAAAADVGGAAVSGEVLGSARGYPEMLSRHPHDREWPLPPSEADKDGARSTTRAFLKIQEGCNAFCTYCIIPYGRGPSRSLGADEVVSAIRDLVAAGTRELVLTGTNLGDYGTDWEGGAPVLTALVSRILEETGLPRLRLSSLDPTEIPEALLELMAREARLCPHFHVSLQSGSARVLRLMKRRYGPAEIRRCLTRIAGLPRRVFVGMDVITGFPGEGEAEHAETLALLRELPWSRLHVFPYSERAGTPATRLEGSVERGVRFQRARELQALSLERLRGLHAAVAGEGKLLEGILLERPQKFAGARWVSGYTPDYLRVLFALPQGAGTPPSALRPNQVISARILGVRVDAASGEVAFEGAKR